MIKLKETFILKSDVIKYHRQKLINFLYFGVESDVSRINKFLVSYTHQTLF